MLLLALVVWPSVARPADDESPLICERSPRTGRPDCWPRVLVEAQGAATARPELPAGAALTLLVVRPLGPFDLRPQDRSPAERMHDAFFGTGDLADLERDLSDDRAAGRAPLLVRDLVTIGIWLMRRGNYDAAGRRLDEAVTVADRHGDPALRGAARLDRGVLLAIQGRYAEALASTQEALVSYRKAAELAPRPQPVTTPDGAAVDDALLRLMTDTATRNATLICLLNLASVHIQIGQYAEAARRLGEARPPDAREVLALRAMIESRAGRQEEANRLVGRATRAKSGLNSVLDYYAAEGSELRSSAPMAAASMPRLPSGAEPSASARLVPAVELAAAERAALLAEVEGRPADALSQRGREALFAAHAGAADRLRSALAGQQRAARALGQRDLAIHYGKRAVEEIRRQRAAQQGLDRNARRAFAEASRRVFESLADDLLESGRLPEAERALLLLRQDDVVELVPPVADLPATEAELALRRDEAGLLQHLTDIDRRRAAGQSAGSGGVSIYEGLAESFASDPAQVEQVVDGYGQAFWPRPDTQLPADRMPDYIVSEMLRQFAALQDCPGLPPQPQVQAARALARRLLERARAEGKEVPLPAMLALRPPNADPPVPLSLRLRCLAQEQALVEGQAAAPPAALVTALAQRPAALAPSALATVEAGRDSLARQADGSVAVHYLVLDERLRILVVTAQGWTLRDVAVPRERIQRAVAALEWATAGPGREASGPARDLYSILIAPIETDLRRVGAQTLLFSPDAALSSVPFAALNDGRGWLVEHYAIARGASLSDGRSSLHGGRLRVAAFGASTGAPGFEALTSVPAELAGVVSSSSGRTWLDRSFTARALRDALLAHYEVIHIASHFALRDDDAGASFVLLGDGARLTLRELGGADYPMRGVDLVTLSACRTARDTRDAWGQGFEGLATLLQRRGAASVLSTLWPVADASTAQLMTSFYRHRAATGKAMALRQAQLELIRGGGAETHEPIRGASREAPIPAADPEHSWAHPYFWAPFVLSGDWR